MSNSKTSSFKRMSRESFLERSKVFFFLHVTRERLPTFDAPIEGAIQDFSLTSKILLHVDFLFTPEIYFYRVNF